MKIMSILLCSALGSLLTASPVSAADAADPSVPTIEGTWAWDFTMPDGAVATPKVTLRQDGETLTGSTGFRPGTEIAISAGHVNADEIRSGG